MFKRIIISFVFAATAQLALGQSSVIDNLTASLKNHAEEDTLRVNILNELSFNYRWIDFFMSQRYAEQSLKLARHLHFDKGIATANYRIAHCCWALGENELAIERGLEASVIADQKHFKSILGESYLILARAYMDQKENSKAESYLKDSKKISLQTNNWDLISRVYNLAGVLQFVKHNRDSALILYNKALSIVNDKLTSKSHLSQITSNIGECYTESDPDLSFKYYKEALAIAKSSETRNKSAEASVTSIIGHTFIKKGSYNEAERYLQESLKLSREMGLKRNIRYVYSGLVNLKIQEGKASDALVYLKKYYDVHDSILNVTKTRQIVEMETKHELEKKELTIQLLERDNKIQMLWRNILISALILISGLSVAIYYLQLFRENKNRKIFNLQIDNLTAQHKELSEKFKDTFTSSNDEPIESSDQRLFKKAIEIVENNMSDSLFGVEQMAKELGMSRTNMHRKIKAITGFPPSELIRNIRLRKAANLLLNQADSVSQIGFKVGFEDHSYFSKSFKKQFGVPPSEYLQSIKQSVN